MAEVTITVVVDAADADNEAAAVSFVDASLRGGSLPREVRVISVERAAPPVIEPVVEPVAVPEEPANG